MRSTDQTKRVLSRALSTRMVDWPKQYSRITDRNQQLDDAAAALAVHAARLSAYISRRRTGGTHDDAVKAQNRVAAKVRRALGFTYRSADINF